jgi:hypothetical protein
VTQEDVSRFNFLYIGFTSAYGKYFSVAFPAKKPLDN